jgi:hypothetical protein
MTGYLHLQAASIENTDKCIRCFDMSTLFQYFEFTEKSSDINTTL